MPIWTAPSMKASHKGSRHSRSVIGRLPSLPRNVGSASADHAPLGAPEVGQHVGIAPAAIAALRPAVEIQPLAAIVDMAVDRARAAQRLAARGGDPPAAGPFAGFGGVEPVHARIDQRVHEAGRNMDEGMPVGRAGLEHADRGLFVFAEAIGEHAACRARAHDHVVEAFHPAGLTRPMAPPQSPLCLAARIIDTGAAISGGMGSCPTRS